MFHIDLYNCNRYIFIGPPETERRSIQVCFDLRQFRFIEDRFIDRSTTRTRAHSQTRRPTYASVELIIANTRLPPAVFSKQIASSAEPGQSTTKHFPRLAFTIATGKAGDIKAFAFLVWSSLRWGKSPVCIC